MFLADEGDRDVMCFGVEVFVADVYLRSCLIAAPEGDVGDCEEFCFSSLFDC